MAKGEAKKKGGCLKYVLIAFAAFFAVGVVMGALGYEGTPQNDTAPQEQNAVVADKTILEGVVANASGNTGEEFTAESYEALQDAIAQAQTVIDDPEATQAQVDDALDNLNEAVSSLVVK